MTKQCDSTSVGVVICDGEGRFALLKRAIFPVGIAPAAGHIDDHGGPEQAAIDEVREELGIKLEFGDLRPTTIHERRVDNVCRRPGGDHHIWTVYEATAVRTNLEPDARETNGAGWYSAGQLQTLANRTRAYHADKVTEDDWQTNPGLEEAWLPFMEELGFVKEES